MGANWGTSYVEIVATEMLPLEVTKSTTLSRTDIAVQRGHKSSATRAPKHINGTCILYSAIKVSKTQFWMV